MKSKIDSFCDFGGEPTQVITTLLSNSPLSQLTTFSVVFSKAKHQLHKSALHNIGSIDFGFFSSDRPLLLK